MNFPPDLSLWQKKEVLYDIFEEYDSKIFTSDFIDELGQDEVNIILEFITNKDEKEYYNIKSILEKYIRDAKVDLDQILKESQKLFLNLKENQSRVIDKNDLELLEKEFE